MSRRLLILLAVLALAVGVLTPVAAGAAQAPELELSAEKNDVKKSPTGSYIVVMAEEPLVAQFGQENLDSSKANAERKKIEESHEDVLTEAGASSSDLVNSYSNAVNGFSAVVSYKEAQVIANRNDVVTVYPDELRQTTTDRSPRYLRLDHKTKGPWANGIVGEGVVIGVIDTGIWPEHPSFADDGSYAAPPITLDNSRPNCEFGNEAHNPLDVPFTCNNKLIGARQMLDTYRAVIGAEDFEYDSARDENGHGTHTASTAGGNKGVEASIFGIDRGDISGVAPRAHIVMYKGLGTLGGFSSDLAAAIDQAVADGVDVINYSIGGGASLGGADDIAFLFAADAGVFVATSAGNSGPNADTVGGPGTVPWLTTVGASTHDRIFQSKAKLGDGSQVKGASVTVAAATAPLVDAEDLGNELCIPGEPFSEDVAGKIVLCRRGAIARVAKSEAVMDAGGVGMILYNTTDAAVLITDNHWVPSVHVNYTNGQKVKAYIDSAGAGATARLTEATDVGTKDLVMAEFSSRGPISIAPDLIKPDVTAPGVNILAGHTPTPEPGSVPGELFQSISGTSMSSPHVAGMFALIKQAHEDWTPAMAKSAVMTTARTDVKKENGKTKADPFDMGAGHITAVEKGNRGSVFDPGLVYDAGLFEYAAFTCGADLGVFSSGSCDFLDSIGIPTDASDLNLPSIGIAELAGSQTVVRTITNVSGKTKTFKAKLDEPKGYNVEVSPKKVKLAPGESATVEITITNKKAPVGEWRFGTLTWSTSGYKVSSPIAVKAALFSAPSAVVGTGVDGAASFDVTFGYGGSYAAAGHGLEPAVVTEDTVVQDPDQTFDPNDGFSNRHDFDLNGAAYFKVAIPPDAVADPNVDLDVFVYDPSGALAGSSTAGGTDEVVEFDLPADGIWSVYVHGWQTAGPSADYDMYSWAISATPGGNLTIDSAPTSATIGSTDPIDLSWTGATAGDWHLGAVSHTGDSGLMGLTLVEVDNR